MLAGEPGYLLDFGGGDITRVYPTDSHTLPVNFEHDLRRLFTVFVKKILEHKDYEVHRRVIIIQ